MIHGKRVCVWTPYGREMTYSLLIRYLQRDVERGLVDEVWAYENLEPRSDGWSNPAGDKVYLDALAATLPAWFQVKQRPEGCAHKLPVQLNTGYAYRYMTDPDTVYIRMDDDIVYLHEDAIENLVTKRLADVSPVATFATMWNNSIVSWFWQNLGLIPSDWTDADGLPLKCGFGCMDPIGWANGQFAVKLHDQLLGHIEAGTVPELYSYQDFSINIGTQFSVSCFASLGSMYADLPHGPGVLDPGFQDGEEEAWHTRVRPVQLGIPNVLVGNAMVAHYTFKPQKALVMASGVLDRYRALADKLTS